MQSTGAETAFPIPELPMTALTLIALAAAVIAAGWWLARSRRAGTRASAGPGAGGVPTPVLVAAGVPLLAVALVLGTGRGDSPTVAVGPPDSGRTSAWTATDAPSRSADADRTDRGRGSPPADPLAATAAALADTTAARRATAAGGPDIDTLLDRLAQRLARQPDDAAGWLMLAHSQASLERFPAAVKAYAEAARRMPGDAQVLADWADALAMTQGRSALGEPTRLLDRAVALDPRNLKARVMSGSAALERGDLEAARRHFEAARAEAPADSGIARAMDTQLAALQAPAGSPLGR